MNVIFVGDSITYAYLLDPGSKGWANRLITDLPIAYPDKNIHAYNEGVTGSNTDNWLKLGWFNSRVLAKSPDIVIIMLGTNDSVVPPANYTWGEQHVDISVYESNIRSMVSQLQAINCKVILATPPKYAPSCYNRYQNLVNYKNKIKQIAIEMSVPLVDTWAVFEPYYNTTIGNYYLSDGLHPNVTGHDLIYQSMWPITERVLFPQRTRPSAQLDVTTLDTVSSDYFPESPTKSSFSVTMILDTIRKVFVRDSIIADTKRSVLKRIEVFGDTLRNVAVRLAWPVSIMPGVTPHQVDVDVTPHQVDLDITQRVIGLEVDGQMRNVAVTAGNTVELKATFYNKNKQPADPLGQIEFKVLDSNKKELKVFTLDATNKVSDGVFAKDYTTPAADHKILYFEASATSGEQVEVERCEIALKWVR